MSQPFFDDKTFTKTDFTTQSLEKGTYENCTFTDCNFSGSTFAGVSFAECTFTGCDLSMVKLPQTALRDVQFKNCKLLGVHFHTCNNFLFTVNFENCMLNLASFYKLGMKKTRFTNCTLHEVDFTETDLSAALFPDCDLAGAVFDQTNLEKTDLSGAYNYAIDPETNRIRKARFALHGLPGLLLKYQVEIS
jgi:fluoroquinolone resistance protein